MKYCPRLVFRGIASNVDVNGGEGVGLNRLGSKNMLWRMMTCQSETGVWEKELHRTTRVGKTIHCFGTAQIIKHTKISVIAIKSQ